ncbi:MAG TPA: M23 family metallopeptidase [Candidatus Pacebacteria bacterium]|nr:M23 family metallopeptidase [Candidatus Paceibacterota bacterium]
MDYGGSRGSNVVAAASGTIVKAYSGCRVGNAKCGGGYGNNIEILHSNGLKTRYAHLHNVIVKKGQKVVSGQLIGGMGNTGHVYPRPRTISSTAGTHLHFEILRGSSRINPNFLR